MVKTWTGNLANTIATDIQNFFVIFKFQICLPMVIYNKSAYSTHAMFT